MKNIILFAVILMSITPAIHAETLYTSPEDPPVVAFKPGDLIPSDQLQIKVVAVGDECVANPPQASTIGLESISAFEDSPFTCSKRDRIAAGFNKASVYITEAAFLSGCFGITAPAAIYLTGLGATTSLLSVAISGFSCVDDNAAKLKLQVKTEVCEALVKNGIPCDP